MGPVCWSFHPHVLGLGLSGYLLGSAQCAALKVCLHTFKTDPARPQRRALCGLFYCAWLPPGLGVTASGQQVGKASP